MVDSGNIAGRGAALRFRRKLPLLVATAFLLIANGLPGLDTEPLFEGEFWVEIDPFVETEEGFQQTPDEIRTRILEQARYVFSGMIYGYTFFYTPYDATREVDEIFTFEAVAQIPWGDPDFTIVDTWVDGNLLRAYVRYIPKEHQLRWIRMMHSNIYHNATAWGSASVFSGISGKYGAVAEGVKEAIRAHLRPRIYNKPKEVTGKVVLTEVPYIMIDAGEYSAKVSVRIDVDKIVPYRMY